MRLDLRSVGIGASEGQEIEERLQMLRGDGFELPAADGKLLDASHSALIGHHRTVREIAGLDFFLDPHIQQIAYRDVFGSGNELLCLIVLHRLSEQGFRFGLALCSGVLLLHQISALVFDVEAVVPLFAFLSDRSFCHRS